MSVNCLKCRHYYITWDEKFPRGCRALNFKSRYFPSDVVRRSSGTHCLSFQEKEIKTDQEEGLIL